MFSNTSPTSRPRPPAKLRRASAGVKDHAESPPPPPYASALAFPTGTNPGATYGPEHDTPSLPRMSMTGIPDEWLKDLSRVELSELLKKADGLIKDSGNELELTSAVAINLNRNSNLKSKHEALLARIPSPSPSTFSTPLSSPHFYTASLPRSSLESISFSQTPQSPRPHHRARKISVSPSDLALLSDQNAELVSKLEKLESESVQADLAGKRKLKKFERDIQLLKDELDRTRERNDEIEAKAKTGFGAKKWGKKERKERVRLLRGRGSGSEDDNGDDEVRDFAPGGPLANESSSVALPSSKPIEPESDPESTSSTVNFIFDSSMPTPPSAPTHSSPPQQEYALVSQLLVKIQELEETNLQITQQQSETTSRLEAVQRDAETIGRVYECLGAQGDVQWEIVPEAEEDAKKDDSPGDTGTIRFRSFRKTLEGDVTKALENSAGTGCENVLNVGGLPHKARKSVVGFFDTTSDQEESRDDDVSGSPFSSGIPFPKPFVHPEDSDVEMTPDNPPRSPALSSLSILTPDSQALQHLATVDGPGQTLGSELGGDEWSLAPGRPSHHFRTSSLYELSRLGSPSPSEPYQVDSPSPDVANAVPGMDDEHSVSSTPRQDRGSRYQKMSQTFRIRTSRWVDGTKGSRLFGASLSAGENNKQPSRSRSPLLESISAPDQSMKIEDETTEIPTGDSHSGGKVNSSFLIRARAADVESVREGKRGVAALIFELWIWMQFVMIILVFLWTMAKRGPKDLLRDTDRQKSVGMH